jgi:S1-C subfamily serine protease
MTVTGDIARSLGMSVPRGAAITDVWPGSPAARAGAQPGDILLTIAGQPVTDEGAAIYLFGARRIGETVPLTVLRDGRELSLNARAEAAPATPARDERVIQGANPFSGATVANLSPAVADEIGADPFAGRGVIVLRVATGPAQGIGLQPGDIVRAVNGREILTTGELTAALTARVRVWQVTIERGGRRITASFRA